MFLPPDQVLISADDHLDIHAMPPDVWSSRLPKEWRDRGPHVEETPIGNVMWASDYPHGDSTWPRSREALAGSPLAQHGPEVLRKVTCENAARVYGFRM